MISPASAGDRPSAQRPTTDDQDVTPQEDRLISTEELAALPLLASVPPEDLARLAQTAGDLRLAAGDYAVHEGDERSLYAVLSGHIEVTKRVDGIERVIGHRHPGQIFGEEPITFGTPFQGSYRATEPTRVAQVSARDFHALAAAHPAVLTHVAALASERIGGLRGIATAPPKARAVMLGQPGDDRVRELRAFLSRNRVAGRAARAGHAGAAGGAAPGRTASAGPHGSQLATKARAAPSR
jgi:thioredoxin reductase (NADPH)